MKRTHQHGRPNPQQHSEQTIEQKQAYGMMNLAHHMMILDDCIIIGFMQEKLNFLRSLKIFSHLSDGQLLQISDLCKGWRFEKGAVIAWQKEVADKLYMVREGILNLYQVESSGNTTLKETYLAGDYFDELWLFGENVHDATIRAETNGRLYMIDQREFETFVEQNPHAELEMVDQAWEDSDQYMTVPKKHDNVLFGEITDIKPKHFSRLKTRESRVNRKLLDEALREAFERFDLQKMLVYELDVPLDEITGQGNLAQVVFDVINYFHKRSELEELIAIAYKERPNNDKLRELAEKYPHHGA